MSSCSRRRSRFLRWVMRVHRHQTAHLTRRKMRLRRLTSAIFTTHSRLEPSTSPRLLSCCDRTPTAAARREGVARGVRLFKTPRRAPGTSIRPSTTRPAACRGGSSSTPATRHPHGATDRQDDGAGWESSTTENLMTCGRRRVETCQGRERFRRRSRGLGLVTGAEGGGPSFSMSGLSRGRYDSPSMTKS